MYVGMWPPPEMRVADSLVMPGILEYGGANDTLAKGLMREMGRLYVTSSSVELRTVRGERPVEDVILALAS